MLSCADVGRVAKATAEPHAAAQWTEDVMAYSAARDAAACALANEREAAWQAKQAEKQERREQQAESSERELLAVLYSRRPVRVLKWVPSCMVPQPEQSFLRRPPQHSTAPVVVLWSLLSAVCGPQALSTSLAARGVS